MIVSVFPDHAATPVSPASNEAFAPIMNVHSTSPREETEVSELPL